MSQPFEVADLFLHQRITSMDCTSVGERAACTVQSLDREEGETISHIWTIALDGSDVTQLTQGSGQDQSPQWSPDGRQLAFLSTRGGGSAQIHVMDLDGGEARQVGSFPQSISNFKWCPDGRSMLVTGAVLADPNLRGRPSKDPVPTRGSSAPEIAWRLPYKEDGVGYVLQRQFHLFSLDLETGAFVQLTEGAFDVLGYDLSGDGRQIAYSRNRDGRFAHCSDLWICNADGTGHRRTTEAHATVMQPVWSPDLRFIAFSGAEEEGDAEPKLWTSTVATGEIRRVGSESLNIADSESLRWIDADRILFVRAFRGRHQVVSMRLDDAEPTVLVGGDRQLAAFGCTGNNLVYSIDHPSLPSDLWVRGRDGGEERALTRFNAWWEERTPIVAEVRRFDVPDGRGGTETIEGWLLRAEGSEGPQPLLNDVHGGPAAYALLDFESNVFWQVLCSQGWAVLALNAVGSASYGNEFCRRLLGHWGEYDMPQHLAAIEQLQFDGVCDERVTISGKSYGGYLSAWSIGHTDVYKAAVVMAPVGNIETHYGTSDGGYYADPYYLNSEPRFDRELARRLSPLQHIEKATTPTLFLQGKEDERCPKCQSEELFVSLLRAGDTPAELVLYPGEGHSFLGSGTASTRQDAAERIVEWLTRFTTAVADTEPSETASEHEVVTA